MALINCPECNNECSASASVCPKCGHPFLSSKVGIKSNKWFIAFVGLFAVLAVAITFWFFAKSKDSQTTEQEKAIVSNINSQIDNQKKTDETSKLSNSVHLTETNVNKPPIVQEKGILNLEAAVIYKVGGVQPVAREKFYLLDEDLESILRKAGLKSSSPETSVSGRLGLAVLYPDQDAQFYQKSMSAIKQHVKYTILTDLQGKGRFENIQPDNYFLFGITTTRNGFAIWSLSTKVKSGQNSETLDSNNAKLAF